MYLAICTLSLFADGAECLKFSSKTLPDFIKPYGSDVKLSIPSGKAVEAEFKNTSNVNWCNKGIIVSLPKQIGWKDFDFLDISGHSYGKVKILACNLVDDNNNNWYSFQKQPLNGTCRFDKESFRYSYNIRDKNAPRPKEKRGGDCHHVYLYRHCPDQYRH